MALLDEIQVRVYRSHIKIPLIFFVPALTLMSVYSLAYFHANSPHFWRFAEAQLHEVLGGHYDMNYVEVGPSLTAVEAYGVDLMTPERESVIEVDRVEASLDPLMLLSGRLEFDRGIVDGGRVRLEYADGSMNLLEALGIYERMDRATPDDDRQAVGFSDIHLRDVDFEFVDRRFGFGVDEVEIPEASVFVEPATVLMSVDELSVPAVDFRFEPELFRFDPERGPWEFTARDFEVENWQWVNEGFTVDRAATEVDGIELEASGRMAFPGGEDDRNMIYEAEGQASAPYHSTVLEYFTDGNIRFDIPRLDIEVAGDFDEIEGMADVHARALEINGIKLDDLRGEVELDNRFWKADRVTGSFYGGELEATNAFFSMLDTRFGADIFFEDVHPRPFAADIADDQPFLDGHIDGGIRLIGEIPTRARPGPDFGYALANDAMTRMMQIEVIEDLDFRRSHQRLFPNQHLEIEAGSEFWLDQRRIGLPYVAARSGDDQFEVHDFYLDYDTFRFERFGGSGPAQIEARLDDIDRYATYYGLDGLRGPADFSMLMEGFFGSPRWDLTGTMERPQWQIGEEVLDGEYLGIELAGRRGDIEIDKLRAETDFGEFQAAGEVGWFQPPPDEGQPRPWPIWEDRVEQPVDLDVVARDVDARIISPLIHRELDARGDVDVDLELGGTYRALRGSFDGRIDDGSVRGQTVDRAVASGAFDPSGVRLDDMGADLAEAGYFVGAGSYGYDGAIDFELEAEDVELAAVRELDDLPMQLGGATRFYLEGEGDVDAPVLSGGGQIRDLSLDDRSYGDVALAADTIDGVVHLAGGLLPWLTATIELPLSGASPYYVRFGMEQLEVLDFLPELEEHPMLDDAQVSGTTELYIQPDFSRYQAIFNLADVDVDSRGQRITNLGNVVVGYNNGEVLTFEQASFESGGRHFSLEGGIGFDPDLLDIRVEGDLDLALLDSARAGFPEYFPDFFVDAQGYANTDMNVRGTPENFVADGTLGFGPSEWSLRFLPEPIDLERGRMNFTDQGIEIPEREPLVGTMLGGETRVAGTMGYLEDHGRAMDMQMWSHNMSYRFPDLATLAFDTDLLLEASDWQDFRSWLVSGDVNILDGVYRQEFNVVEQQFAGRVIGAFQPRTDQYEAGLLEAVPILNDIEFDLQLQARDGFRVESELDRIEADLEFRFDLLLRDTLANPRLIGDLDVIDGELAFQGEAFEVRSGTIGFSEDISNPYLDIEAGADVRNTCEESDFVDESSQAMTLSSNIGRTAGEREEYHVMMHLQGEMENLDLHMESNPYADQRDILSLLLTGCTVDRLTATGASRPTLEVALGPLLGRLEGEIEEVAAVDEFSITPGVERTQVRIGDRPGRRLSWRFHLDTGFADATGGQQYQLEYRLSDRWTAEPSVRRHDEDDDWLVDFKLNYRVPLD